MGFIYGLVGVEYTLIWNATGLLNFSHDKIIVLGAYMFGGAFIMRMGLPVEVAAVLNIIFMAGFGALMAICIFNPLRNMSSGIFAVMGTLLFGKIIYDGIPLVFGPRPFTIPGFLSGVITIGGATIARAYPYIIVACILIVVSLQLLFKYTKLGKAMRCVAQNKQAAELMGINVTRNINLTVALSAMICGILGVLVIPLFTININMTAMIGLKGFAAGVIGGFGYLPGAILGGILIGVFENVAVMVLPSIYKDVTSFVILIAVLMIKPTGILGGGRVS
jgi:branched-chain amino acid transport system permease protein